MTIPAAIDSFFASQAGQLALWVLLLPILDFVLGVTAAIRDGTFELDGLASVLRKHGARVFGIWVLLGVGHFADEYLLPVADVPALTAIGIGAAGLYVAETVGSILRSWGPSSGPPLVTRDDAQPRPDA